jgi:hypothetical protein
MDLTSGKYTVSSYYSSNGKCQANKAGLPRVVRMLASAGSPLEAEQGKDAGSGNNGT